MFSNSVYISLLVSDEWFNRILSVALTQFRCTCLSFSSLLFTFYSVCLWLRFDCVNSGDVKCYA